MDTINLSQLLQNKLPSRMKTLVDRIIEDIKIINIVNAVRREDIRTLSTNVVPTTKDILSAHIHAGLFFHHGGL